MLCQISCCALFFSEGQHGGLRQTVRLYAVKFLVLEAAAAVAAALECLLTIIFAGRI